MEIILKENVKGLGYKNDIISVKPGYGRNYLIPKGLAILANASNKKMIAENVKQASHKAAKVKQDAEALAESLAGLTLTISTKAGESGKIFGAITTLQVSDALRDKSFEVDRKQISFESDIKHIGQHKATLDLHKEVKQEITLDIVTE